MKKILIVAIFASFIFTQQTTSYSWEDGSGTILGSYGNLSSPENVGQTSGVSPHDGDRMLTVSESPIDGTPQAFIAWITDLQPGQEITACFYGYDNTPSSSPSLRIWGSWSINDDIESYQGSADGNTAYTDGTGWSQLCHTFSTNQENWDSGEALIIQARLYSGSTDPTVYFIDLVEITAPNNAIVNYPGGDASDGCTDPTACNYNPFAANDDGSCTYPTDMSIYDIQYTLNQGDYCYESDYDQTCVKTTGTVTAVSPEYPNFYIQNSDEECSIGDLNEDGSWNVLDVVQLANCVLAADCNGCAGDLNEDGSYNVLDIVQLANCILAATCEDRSYSGTFSGIYVHNMFPTPSLGENITIIATVNEYYSLTQLIDGSSFTVNSTGASIEPIDITTGDLANGCTETGESLESMLVRISNISVSQTSNEFGEWYVDDGTGSCKIDDKIFDGVWLDPSYGQEFASIVGVVDYAYSEFSIFPRTASDFILCPTCPVANAGDDQFVSPNAEVTLDGTSSYDPDGEIVYYEWIQISGNLVSLANEEASLTTFIAPNTNSDLVFELTVYDNDYNGATDQVTISVGTGTPIQDIQCPSDLSQGSYCYETSLNGDEVSTYGIVTHVLEAGHSSEGNFFLQQPSVNTCGGIFIRDFDIIPNVGDELTLSGSVNEYYSFTQIENVTSYSINSSGGSTNPMIINTGDLGIDCSLSGEYLESMLVQINNVTVEAIDEFGNVQVNDGTGSTLMDDYYFDGSWPNILVGNTYTSIIGVVGYSYSEFKIYPRNSNDFEN